MTAIHNTAPLLYAPTLELFPTAELVTPEQPSVPLLSGSPHAAELSPEQERDHYETGLALVGSVMAEPKHLRFPHPFDAILALRAFRDNQVRLSENGEYWVNGLQEPVAVEEYIADLLNEAAEQRTLSYWLCEGGVEGDAPIIGALSLFGHNADQKVAQFAAWIDEKHEGQGYMRRSALALFNYARQVWGLKHVLARMALNNVRAHKGVQRLGFEPLELVPATWLADAPQSLPNSGQSQWWIKDLAA